MSRKHGIRAAIGRLVTRAASSVEPVMIIPQGSEPPRAKTAHLMSVVSVLGSPMTFAAIPLLIESEGGRRVPRSND